MDTVYKFDITRLTPLDWYYWGMTGYYNIGTITYLIQKAAQFDLVSMPESEHGNIGYAFGIAVNEYIQQFLAAPPNSPTGSKEATSEDITALFRKITRGE